MEKWKMEMTKKVGNNIDKKMNGDKLDITTNLHG